MVICMGSGKTHLKRLMISNRNYSGVTEEVLLRLILILKNLGGYEVCRSGENRAEVKYMDKRWEFSLDERKCICRVWQVIGIPCVHATTFIIFTRDVNWDKYFDSYFTIKKFKLAYALEVAPMPTKEEWRHIYEEKIYPPKIKRPPERPRKNIIKAHNELKKDKNFHIVMSMDIVKNMQKPSFSRFYSTSSLNK